MEDLGIVRLWDEVSWTIREATFFHTWNRVWDGVKGPLVNLVDISIVENVADRVNELKTSIK